jgi:predicted amidohydrolase
VAAAEIQRVIELKIITNPGTIAGVVFFDPMKICIAQIRPVAGNIEQNIQLHKQSVEQAIARKADLILFPELSLSGYEPRLAEQLATTQEDERLDVFQAMSETHGIVIWPGIPTRSEAGIHISILIFQPDGSRTTYSKQLLHEDELPYFVPGQTEVMINCKGKKIAPAICYESLQTVHAEKAHNNGADIYLASVAKSAKGVEKAYVHYPLIAKQHGMIVLMSNSIGPSDDFVGAGASAVWNGKGELVERLNGEEKGMLVYDVARGVGCSNNFNKSM